METQRKKMFANLCKNLDKIDNSNCADYEKEFKSYDELNKLLKIYFPNIIQYQLWCDTIVHVDEDDE